MKKPFSSFNVKKIRIDKRILLVLGIIFVVSPGWILGLYWMKYQKLPWESAETVEHEKLFGEDIVDYSQEPVLDIVGKLETMPQIDVTREINEVDAFHANDIKDIDFYGTTLKINGKMFTITKDTEMLDRKFLTVEEGISYLKDNHYIDVIYYQKEERYITSIDFAKISESEDI